jgi:hypothetical protein
MKGKRLEIEGMDAWIMDGWMEGGRQQRERKEAENNVGEWVCVSRPSEHASGWGVKGFDACSAPTQPPAQLSRGCCFTVTFT